MILATGTVSPAVVVLPAPRDLTVLGIALSSTGDGGSGQVSISLNPTQSQTNGILAIMAVNLIGIGTGASPNIFIPIKTFLQAGRAVYLYDTSASNLTVALLLCEAS